LGIANPEDILEIADGEVRAAAALRDDLLAALFPYGERPPSELLQTRVKLKLQALVTAIQVELGVQDAEGRSWDVLARSGLLREPALIDFALARMAEEQLQRQLSAIGHASPLAQLPVTLLAHENARIAEMAKKLLQAEQLASDERYLFKRMAPEQLHLLCWRIVAALQNQTPDEQPELLEKAKALLSAHSVEDDPAMVARKLAFFLGSDWQSQLADPGMAGLHLLMAMLSQTLLLPTDQLIRLIAEGGIEPALLIFKAASMTMDQAASTLSALRGSENGWNVEQPGEAYNALDMVEVRAQIANWTLQAGATA
jgi:hypothetical protein